jgi:hypothetical protein
MKRLFALLGAVGLLMLGITTTAGATEPTTHTCYWLEGVGAGADSVTAFKNGPQILIGCDLPAAPDVACQRVAQVDTYTVADDQQEAFQALKDGGVLASSAGDSMFHPSWRFISGAETCPPVETTSPPVVVTSPPVVTTSPPVVSTSPAPTTTTERTVPSTTISLIPPTSRTIPSTTTTPPSKAPVTSAVVKPTSPRKSTGTPTTPKVATSAPLSSPRQSAPALATSTEVTVRPLALASTGVHAWLTGALWTAVGLLVLGAALLTWTSRRTTRKH